MMITGCRVARPRFAATPIAVLAALLVLAQPQTRAQALAQGQTQTAAPGAAATGTVEAQSGAMRIRVTALADDLLRVRVAPAGAWPEDASWVVPAELRAHAVSVQVDNTADSVGFRTAALQVHIERSTLRLVVADLAGKVVLADSAERPIDVRGTAFELHKALPVHEHYFGLGDKTGPLDRRGESFTDWNTDAYGFQSTTDPLYKSIPFFIGTGGGGASYGVFLDNTWRTWFDFGHRDPKTLALGSDNGPIDYYIIYGPTLARVVERYTDLSGKAPLPPLWSLGFQQSRYSYMSADEVRSVATRMRAERIPADVIWLDIDYQDRNRPFTTDPKTYPDLPALVRDVKQLGFHLVTITDLHVADAAQQGYTPFDSGMAGDHFIKRADGSLYVGEVWPGPSVFPDFTRAATRQWWGGLFQDFLSAGVAGFWNDMNEPALFKTSSKTMPPDVVHRIDEPGFAPRSATHAEIHNVYGMENSRATFDGLLRLAPDERPFVMTRASFAGGQRYASTWTGDNSATWNHLKLSVSMLLNLGMSGFSWSGSDVGGFKGTYSPDLLTRWMEIAAFTPIFRLHSEKDSVRKEPWVNGPEQTAIRRRFIEARYRLLPYLYALADENARTGAPLMRPVFYDYPELLDSSCDQANSFFLGERLLIAPPPDMESPGKYPICLPQGKWYDYWTGIEVQPQAPSVAVPADEVTSYAVIESVPELAKLPVFVRAGAILPRQPLVQNTGANPQGPLSLEIYPGDDCRGTLYADDGHSLAYERGLYLRQTVRCTVTDSGVSVTFETRAGSFQPWWKSLDVIVHGWRGGVHATLDGTNIAAVRVASGAAEAHVTIADQVHPAVLTITRQ